MDPEDVVNHDFGCFFGRRQFRQGDKSVHLGKPVHHGEDRGVALGNWEPSAKSNEMSAHGLEGMGSGCRSPMRRPVDTLFLAHDRTCLDVP